MNGQVILLNGVSSGGKTTLAKAIQKYSEDIWLHVAMDTFITMLPDGRETGCEWFPVKRVKREGVTLPCISNGSSGEALLAQMRRMVCQFSDVGFNVVVDEVAEIQAITDYCLGAEGACILVKVDAPLEELERRELRRGDRLIGLAREQSARLHTGIEYDLEVDTHAETPDAAARRVLAAVAR